jgi:hypothetical protein
MAALPRVSSFAEFWPVYLREHRRPATRALHYLGTAIAIMTAIYAVATASWWLLIVPLVSGYLFAWAGHALIEHNRPATFTYPLWSLRADFRMFGYFVSGRIGAELRRAGVETR